MIRETMTVEERVRSAFNNEKPDRLPVGPHLQASAAATLTGRKQAQVAYDQIETHQAELEVFDSYGGWDFKYIPVAAPGAVMPLMGMKVKLPGVDLPEDTPYQVVEEEIMTVEDYDRVIENGWEDFFTNDLLFRVTSDPKIFEELGKRAEVFKTCMKNWSEREVFTSGPAGDNHPFFKLSLARSVTRFTEDLYYRPEIVKKALDKMAEETIKMSLERAEMLGSTLAILVEERASGYFYPPQIFEKYWWKYTREIVDAHWSKGLVTVFHLDCSWDKNIEYFRELPKGSAVLHLDGTTDIFAAKEKLKGHLCLMGDVHPSLQAIGKPDEVEAYVKRLIDEVGYDGGLIISSGCDVPANVKPENFKAILDTAKSYKGK